MNPADNSIWLSEAVKGMKKEVYSNKEYDIFEEQPDNLYISLCNTAALFPGKFALVEQERQVTFKQFKEMVDRTASNLYSTYGVRKRDRVALLMVDSIDFCICFYALAKLGSISMH
ncbi:AMP-binding protein [Petroclostridium sp. X23]|uniref:AMP-binding protein n=1 Tax=Petroclostridium sp. X23 TaxID=3045146 RepID=UPI0024AD26FE|nr:AMP-binding protein [Petroclostridium sp. X23]WHH59035.1 AMP-binding protein [Petroclostridium sp. X23]